MGSGDRNCPLMDGDLITFTDCIENCSIAEGYIKPECLPEKARKKENFRDICLNCKYHEE